MIIRRTYACYLFSFVYVMLSELYVYQFIIHINHVPVDFFDEKNEDLDDCCLIDGLVVVDCFGGEFDD